MSFIKKAALSLVMTATVTSQALAGVVFSDGFESGSRSLIMNNILWGDSVRTIVNTARPKSGANSLEFRYPGVALGQDSFSEQRIKLGQGYTELWVKYDMYLPSNYFHRNDGASNNKFFAIFSAPYTTPGFQVNFSTLPTSSGGSTIEVHSYRNGAEQGVKEGGQLFGDADKGKWHRVVMHFKVPSSSSSSDGVMELWKNGQAIYSNKVMTSVGTSGKNYMDEAYILGWSNSGFTQDTYMYVDDVVISTDPISTTADVVTPTATPPSPPTLRVN